MYCTYESQHAIHNSINRFLLKPGSAAHSSLDPSCCGMMPVTVLCSLVCLCLWFSAVAGDCYDDPQGNNKSYDNCDTCYQTLVNALINTGDNKYQLSRRFFPDDQAAPIEVRVEYSPVSQSDSQSINNFAGNGSIIWYWLAGEFYEYQPLKLFLYRSLFFSPPPWRSQKVTLNIPENCLSVAPADFLTYLTQRVS